MIKQPEPSKTHPGFDPHYDLAEAKGRWGYTLGNMVELGFLTTQQRAEAVYPESTLVPYDPDGCQAQCAGTKPIGHVLAYVKQELKQMASPTGGRSRTRSPSRSTPPCSGSPSRPPPVPVRSRR